MFKYDNNSINKAAHVVKCDAQPCDVFFEGYLVKLGVMSFGSELSANLGLERHKY